MRRHAVYRCDVNTGWNHEAALRPGADEELFELVAQVMTINTHAKAVTQRRKERKERKGAKGATAVLERGWG
ncbi:MAG: hypothetical protein D6823_03390 [Chloroflexi bacterium]|nr:MAG: hypothetical protein D6823_03390 [Chloroflexota bacterium]